jgi:hypothetical protein
MLDFYEMALEYPGPGWYAGGPVLRLQLVFDADSIAALRQICDFTESFELGRADNERTTAIDHQAKTAVPIARGVSDHNSNPWIMDERGPIARCRSN